MRFYGLGRVCAVGDPTAALVVFVGPGAASVSDEARDPASDLRLTLFGLPHETRAS